MMTSPDLASLIDALPSVVVYVDDKLALDRRDASHASLALEAIAASRDARFESDAPALPTDQAPTPLTLLVPPRFHSTVPLAIIHIAQSQPIHKAIHIELGQSAEMTLIAVTHNEVNQSATMHSSILVGDNAHLTMMSVNSSEGDGAHASRIRGHVNRDATFNFAAGVFTHGPTHYDTEITLAGPHAENESRVVALTDDAQETLINTRVIHKAPRTAGRIEHAGVAAGESTLLFEGVGKIHKGMVRSQAFQHNRGVVLGDKARLDANPLLLIDEHDVEAGHGAAIGRIDENQLYYLMSRGMTKTEAEKLIIQGYLAPLKRTISHDALHARLDQLLNDKIK